MPDAFISGRGNCTALRLSSLYLEATLIKETNPDRYSQNNAKKIRRRLSYLKPISEFIPKLQERLQA